MGIYFHVIKEKVKNTIFYIYDSKFNHECNDLFTYSFFEFVENAKFALRILFKCIWVKYLLKNQQFFFFNLRNLKFKTSLENIWLITLNCVYSYRKGIVISLIARKITANKFGFDLKIMQLYLKQRSLENMKKYNSRLALM